MSSSDSQHVLASTRDEAIRQRTKSWVATKDASEHRCIQHRLSGNVLWSLWERTTADGARDSYISCDVLSANRVGWSFQSFSEAHGLTYVSCPLEYLDAAPVVSRAWRANVAAYWRGESQTFEQPRRTFTRTAPVLSAGARVRYIGTASDAPCSGTLGTVAVVPGQSSVHADALRRTTYIQWDNGSAGSVFNTHLELIDEYVPRFG